MAPRTTGRNILPPVTRSPARSAGEFALLTGREKGRLARDLLSRLGGRAIIDIIIGTHALFQEDVAFKDLALRRGRMSSIASPSSSALPCGKGRAIDILVMTATPIPRSLMLTGTGDLDYHHSSPKNRRGASPSRGGRLPLSRVSTRVIEASRRALASDAKIYWICPLVTELRTRRSRGGGAAFPGLKSPFWRPRRLVHGA